MPCARNSCQRSGTARSGCCCTVLVQLLVASPIRDLLASRMAEKSADGKGRESAGSEFLRDGLGAERKALLGDTQKPLVYHHILAERVVAQKLAAGKFLKDVGKMLRKRIEAAAFAGRGGV